MTCGYKRRDSNYLLVLARLPANWREDEPGQEGHDNAFYAPVALQLRLHWHKASGRLIK